MKSFTLSLLLTIFILQGEGFLHGKKPPKVNSTDSPILSSVKIYSNLAEIIQPLSKPSVDFTAEEWSDIRSDSITLVGANVTVTQQSISEQKKSLNNAEVYVRSPLSSSSKTEFVKAKMIDETRNIVELIEDKISKQPIYLTAASNDIIYAEVPPQSKYHVSFVHQGGNQMYVSYLRSNLNWKTRYQLNLFEDTKAPILIAMADIRNDGQSKIDIEHAELLGGDINLQVSGSGAYGQPAYRISEQSFMASVAMDRGSAPAPPKLARGEELSGLYVFTVDQSFSIDAKTNYILPMFRPRVTLDRFALISNTFYGTTSSSSGKAKRSYRLISDRFLSRGNCLIRELDRLVGETHLPDLAAKDKHEFSIGQDADITYTENSTLISSRNITDSLRTTARDYIQRTQSTYEIYVSVKNFKTTRGVKVEYEQQVYGQSVKLITPNTMFTQDGTKIKTQLTVGADEQKTLSYRVEIIN